ncbi:hypothetical protein [Actinophytocola sp.]|uniref:hypothetical protein n=1 Tax=Actinophytocola sp. TaxID=1872138 RepID=UPI003899D1BD
MDLLALGEGPRGTWAYTSNGRGCSWWRCSSGGGVHRVGFVGLVVPHVIRMVAGRPVGSWRVRACGPLAEVLTRQLLTDVYRREVEVLALPRSGTPLVLPVR